MQLLSKSNQTIKTKSNLATSPRVCQETQGGVVVVVVGNNKQKGLVILIQPRTSVQLGSEKSKPGRLIKDSPSQLHITNKRKYKAKQKKRRSH